MNVVTLIGRLGADPEVKKFNDGGQVTNIRLATSERWKDRQTGEKKEHTDWHSVAVFGPLAEVVENYCKKGDQIMVSGALKTRKWQDKDGNDRYSTEVVLQGPRAQLELLGSKGSGGGDAKAESQRNAYGDATGSGYGGDSGGSSPPKDDRPSYNKELEDEIPF